MADEVNNRKRWTRDEDDKLIQDIWAHGIGNWGMVPDRAGVKRSGKSCRERWTNYLRPDIKRGKFSAAEDHQIIHLHSVYGNSWSTIASKLSKRTSNEIRNYWNTHLIKERPWQVDNINHPAPSQNHHRDVAQPITSGLYFSQQYCNDTDFTDAPASLSWHQIVGAGNGLPKGAASSSVAVGDENLDDCLNEFDAAVGDESYDDRNKELLVGTAGDDENYDDWIKELYAEM